MRIRSCKQVGVAFVLLSLAGCSAASDDPGSAALSGANGDSKDSDSNAEGTPSVASPDSPDDHAGDEASPGAASPGDDVSPAGEPISGGDDEAESPSGTDSFVPSSPVTTATGTTGAGPATGAAPIGMPTSAATSPVEPVTPSPADPVEGDEGSSDDGASDSDDEDSTDAAGEPASEDAGAEADEPAELPEPPPPPPPANQAGLLTAGVWDDNRNFDRFESFRDGIYQSGAAGLLDFEVNDYADANDLFSQAAGPREMLDIALVIDTTGSMGDEMQYLQTEMRSISMRIEKVYPDAEQRWALIVYRDVGDEYVTQTFDFDTDLDTFRDNLAAQSVGGGGDFPEAPEAALEAMNQLAWRGDENVARLAFWVADAPYHEERADDMTAAIVGAQDQGIHVYPVASSGIDEFTELGMRSVAQLTGGRYIFLTDDSGVGGAHLEPSIPCYFVTRLDVAMLRMVNIEMSGEYQVPAEDEIVRSGGDPQDGACELSSGDAVFVF